MNSKVKIENMKRPPTHPGIMLLEEFIKPSHMTQVELAEAINVPIQRVNEVVNQKRGVSPETALRLGKYFGVSADFWLGLQKNYDLWSAYQKEKEQLDIITPRSIIKSGVNRLSDWLSGLIDGAWELPGTFSENNLVPARTLSQEKLLSREAVYDEILKLYQKDGVENSPPPSEDGISALVSLIRSSKDSSILKDAIDLLKSLDPENSLFSAVREKDLSLFLSDVEVALRIIFISRTDQQYSVLIQIYPIGESSLVPEGLKISILDEDGNKVGKGDEANAGVSFMNRPVFVDKGDKFGLRVSLGESEMTEFFVV